jgi:hypothetical protein
MLNSNEEKYPITWKDSPKSWGIWVDWRVLGYSLPPKDSMHSGH